MRRRSKNAAAQPVADRSEDHQRDGHLGDRQQAIASTMQHCKGGDRARPEEPKDHGPNRME
jgi:hypothetical protein